MVVKKQVEKVKQHASLFTFFGKNKKRSSDIKRRHILYTILLKVNS